MTGFADTSPPNAKHLLLLGAGPSHLQFLLRRWRRHRPPVRITLAAMPAHPVPSALVPNYVAGHQALPACTLDLEQIARARGMIWLARAVRGLDPATKQVLLDDGSTVSFDWLSIDASAVMPREQMERQLPGAREHGLFVRPAETFCSLWPRVRELAGGRDLRLAVMGAGSAAIELALAMRHGLPGSAVTLVAGQQPIGHGYPAALRQHLCAALRSRRIAVLPDTAAAISATEVELATGARLACDVPVIALPAMAPAWLASSALALDAQGLIALDAFRRSTSHPHIFAAGELAGRRADAPTGDAVHADAALVTNLLALVNGDAPRPIKTPTRVLRLLGCGDREAIASWGNWCAEGRWVWHWKRWLDQRWLRS